MLPVNYYTSKKHFYMVLQGVNFTKILIPIPLLLLLLSLLMLLLFELLSLFLLSFFFLRMMIFMRTCLG